MKNKHFFPIVLILCIPFIFSSCSKSNLEGLTIHDVNNGYTSLNPLLSWKDDGSSYTLTIHDDSNNEKVGSYKDVNSPYSLGGYLDLDTTYTVKVVNKKTKAQDSLTFTTMKEGASKMDSLSSFLLVYGAYDDNMVIQRDKPFKIRGFAKKGVQVSAVLNDEIYTSISDGDWEIEIPAHSASSVSTTLTVIASNSKQKTFKNILFGDVYLVAGQSNIQWPIKDSDYLDEDLNIDSNKVRFFAQNTSTRPSLGDNFDGSKWFKYDKNDEGNQLYSAIGLMLGSMLSKQEATNNVPIGIMYAAQGDTSISKWMDAAYYSGSDIDAGVYYNSMVHPFKGLNVKGVIWYQGCNDSSKAVQYKDNLLSLFRCYRDLFNDNSLPIYVVQLPCFNGDDGNKFNFAYIRDAQYKACLEDNNSYLIATCDGGDPGYIHPYEKRYICERLTKSILAVCYGLNTIKESPTVKEISIDNERLIITLNNAEGLHSETCKGFVLAGENGKFYDANAEIEGNKIILSSSKIANPVYVRYGFSRSPFLDIYNKDGFLLSPFRNDDYDKNIDILDYNNASLYQVDINGEEVNISIENEHLIINKKASDINYAAFNLDRWAPICHVGSKLRIIYKGSASNNEIQIRFIESSYEIWSLSFIDDTDKVTTKDIDLASLTCTYNPIDNKFDYEAIMQVGILIKGTPATNLEILELKII